MPTQHSLPLSSPVHEVVSGHDWRQPEENLVSCAAEGVEDSGVSSACERLLSVWGEAVGDNAFLGLGA